MEKIFVTGSTGFIGTKLVEKLKQQGHTVIVDRTHTPIDCDRIYHLACPSTNTAIYTNPTGIMDTVFDGTRAAMKLNSNALFITASSKGADFTDVDNSPQNAYNIAKRCMEVYLEHSGINYKNYRIPSVYGPGAHSDSFVVRCINGTANFPIDPYKMHYIAHIDDVVDALANLTDITIETLPLGKIYELFNSGRRGIHRPTFN